jgi:SHS2 domain-containing protein
VRLCRYGDIFDPEKHSSGTEIKAITYSAMQVHEAADRTDLYVIVDI